MQLKVLPCGANVQQVGWWWLLKLPGKEAGEPENWISPFSPYPKLSVFLWERRGAALPCFLFTVKLCLVSCGGLNKVVAWQRQNVNFLYKYTSCDPGKILIVLPNVTGRSAPTFAAIALSYSIDVIYDLT